MPPIPVRQSSINVPQLPRQGSPSFDADGDLHVETSRASPSASLSPLLEPAAHVKSAPASNLSSPKAKGSPKKTALADPRLPEHSPIIVDRSISNTYFYPSSQVSQHAPPADAVSGNGGSSEKNSLKLKPIIRSSNSSVKSDRGSPVGGGDSANASPRVELTSRPSSQAFNPLAIAPPPQLTHSISASSNTGFVNQVQVVPSAESSVILTPLDFIPGARYGNNALSTNDATTATATAAAAALAGRCVNITTSCNNFVDTPHFL